MIDIEEVFERHADEYRKFDRVEKKLHSLPDVCAFIMLARLSSTGLQKSLVSAVERDTLYLSVEPGDVANTATEDDLVTLIRCGVVYDSLTDSFAIVL